MSHDFSQMTYMKNLKLKQIDQIKLEMPAEQKMLED